MRNAIESAHQVRQYLRQAAATESLTERMSLVTQMLLYVIDDPTLLSNESFRGALTRRLPEYHAEVRAMRTYVRRVQRHCAALERAMRLTARLLQK